MGIPRDLIREYKALSDWCILSMYRGSIAHGMYVPNSDPNSIDDKDAMVICVPPIEYYYGLRQFGSRGTQEIKRNEWDIVVYEARKFLSLLAQGNPNVLMVLWLDEKIIKDAFYMEVCLVGPGTKSTGEMVKPHVHDFNEIIGFIGTSVEDPQDLGGEVIIWLDDEKHVLTKTCMVYVPAGLKHCPLSIEKVSRPIVHYSVMTGKQYLWTYV